MPALDDGAPDARSGLELVRALAGLGFDTVYATPHQKVGSFLPAWDDVRAAHTALRADLAAAGIGVELGLGAENFWDDVFFARSSGPWSVPVYGEGPAFLFEIPRGDVPVAFEDTLFQLAARGRRPVLAHPERYLPFHRDLDRLHRLGENVALLVDLGALGGFHGDDVGKFARRLLTERIAHAVASDVHTAGDARAAAAGMAWITKKLGAPALHRLLSAAPRTILAGELPDRDA